MIVSPLYDRVLVRPISDDATTKSGLLIPDIARNSSVFGYGEVVGVGPGRYNERGELMKMGCKVGATVMYPRKVGLVVPIPIVEDDGTLHDVDFLLFRDPEIFAKVTGLQKQTRILDADAKRLLAMTPFSRARPDVGYVNADLTEQARRAGFLDRNPDGTDDHVDETEGLP